MKRFKLRPQALAKNKRNQKVLLAAGILFLVPLIFAFQNCGPGFIAMDPTLQSLSGDSAGDDSGNFDDGVTEPPAPPTPVLGLTVSNPSARQSLDVNFEIRIAPQAQPVVVSYQTVDATAINTTDYVATRGTVTIAPGEVSARVRVPTLFYTPSTTAKSFTFNATASLGPVTENQMGQAQIRPLATVATFKKIASGESHSCGITPQDTVKCWGANRSGQLGSGPTIISSSSPVDVVGLTGAKAISVGSAHSCAITAQDTVRCWGNNSEGQLGNSSTTTSSVPVDVAGLSGIKAISIGGSHSCAITAQDTVKCWGSNLNGKLGNNTITPFYTVPVDVVGLSGIKAISMGGSHSCAITAQDTVKCWGYNGNGQLGTNTRTTALAPEDVLGVTGVKAIALGSEHSCAITAQDTVRCWGANSFGQLGNTSLLGSPYGSPAPVDVVGLTGVKSISMGRSHSCAITAQDTVKCWGYNGAGQLGNSAAITSAVPADVAGLTGVRGVSLGDGFSCAITAQDTVRCWGNSNLQQLGYNTSIGSSVPIDVVGLNGIKAISMGEYQYCAITAQDTVRCRYVDGSAPMDIAGLTGVKAISVGRLHSCAITAQDTVKCWGLNNGGQLGNNTAVSSSSPVDVIGLASVKAISLGSGHSCAITAQDTVRCWGYNGRGQLGDNTTTLSLVPVDVAGLTGVKAISLGAEHSCAITAQDSVKCWGYNSGGQLGNNSTAHSSVPVDVVGLTGIKAISAGGFHTCAITAQDSVKCWAYNGSGQLGNNTTRSSLVPVDVVGLTGVKALSTAGEHSCAITAQDTARCWGSNFDGQFGNGRSGNSSVPVEAFQGQRVFGIAVGAYGSSIINFDRNVRHTGRFRYLIASPAAEILILN